MMANLVPRRQPIAMHMAGVGAGEYGTGSSRNEIEEGEISGEGKLGVKEAADEKTKNSDNEGVQTRAEVGVPVKFANPVKQQREKGLVAGWHQSLAAERQ